MKYTGKSIDDLQDEIAELLGKYIYLGIMKNTQTAFYVQEEYTGMQGTIYKDWERDDGWVGTVIYSIIWFL